ncbi:MAG: sigma-54-dependent Fis family transcriptional regulator, partial [Deltaproteobacteria bacterium]|nr:sigma-54-dependent Fis family transcriptional regulator [Deltaproteobacteria bacterium]
MRAALHDLRRYARTDLPALITGETGTGKELFAHELHRLSPRAARPFVAVSCPNLPAQLVESELFGHRRGAFTGAVDSRVGAFEMADGGTLFLYEIGDMPLDVQARILRVLQEGTFRRLGENREVRVDVRVVAATHRDLEAMVAARTFREDLFHRLACCVVRLPPLRERGHDVVRIARALLAEGAGRHGLPQRGLSREAEAVLRVQPWPGNVREMQRALFRAAATGTGRSIRAADLARALG